MMSGRNITDTLHNILRLANYLIFNDWLWNHVQLLELEITKSDCSISMPHNHYIPRITLLRFFIIFNVGKQKISFDWNQLCQSKIYAINKVFVKHYKQKYTTHMYV